MVYDDRKLLLRDEETVAALGYEPVGFSAAPDALAACRAAPERFDVLLVSQGAAIEPALDIATALHGIAPHLPILLAVASTARIDADALAAAGVSDVVRRPLVSANVGPVLKSVQSRKLAGVSA
jgi:AmiR/NasT family two-component response regulator